MENASSLSYVGHLEGKEYTHLWREWKINSWVETSLPSDFVWMGKYFGCFYFQVFAWYASFLYFLCLVYFFVAFSTLPVFFFLCISLLFISMIFFFNKLFQWSFTGQMKRLALFEFKFYSFIYIFPFDVLEPKKSLTLVPHVVFLAYLLVSRNLLSKNSFLWS